MFRSLFYTLLLAPCLALASVEYQELIVKDQDGKMLRQVSGLANLDDWIVVLVQDRNSLYVAKQARLDKLFNDPSQLDVSLTPVKIKVGGLATASWEAVEFAEIKGKTYAFFFHEHDSEGDNHQIFVAQVNRGKDSFTLSELHKLGDALPILQNEELNLGRRQNYGYEALVWDETTERLLLLPELMTQDKFGLGLDGELVKLGVSTHKLRASDLTKVNNDCAVAVSFCYHSESFQDALCEGNGQSPKLSFATFAISKQGLVQTSSKDFTQALMPVGFDPAFSDSKQKGRTFNAEGIANFKSGFVIANDNIPQNKARTVLRYVKGIELDAKQCSLR